jgi:tetratricopeptide (TPR) repeat protein
MSGGNCSRASAPPDCALLPEPPDALGLNRRGIARLTAGDIEGALADFHRAATLRGDYPEPWNNAGLVRQLLGQPREAVADFDRALAVRPDYPEALTNRGRALQALGDSRGARADFDSALGCAAGPFAASVLHNRGLLRQEDGDLAGALADFDRALEIDPRHTAAYVTRGLARKEAGRLEEALADFDRALEQTPAHGLATVYHGRGGVRVLQNDFAGALADYDRALGLEPENFAFYVSRGNARYHRREPQAVVDYHMAFRLDPDGTARELLRILTADVRRDAAAVLDNCTQHLRLSDRDVLAYARRGLTLLLLGREAEAAADCAQVHRLAPELRAPFEGLIERAHRRRRSPLSAPLAFSPAAPTTEAIDAVFAGKEGPLAQAVGSRVTAIW